jgi:hypothetical protein
VGRLPLVSHVTIPLVICIYCHQIGYSMSEQAKLIQVNIRQI